jgi:dienelactone hydrolase
MAPAAEYCVASTSSFAVRTEATLRGALRRRILAILMIVGSAIAFPELILADERPATPKIQEEVWALPLALPMFAYLVRPVGTGPFPLVIMNHGVANDPKERSFFPLVEFRDAARWFAHRGYMVVAPVGPGFGGGGLDVPDHGIYGLFFSSIGNCDNPDFRNPGLAAATLDIGIINYMTAQKLILPDNVIVVGQSAGGWGAIALSSLNPAPVRAIITFAAGRGGHVDGKPNKNCAPDKLVAATEEFGRTSRIPMLWIYTSNDTFFGPELSKRMHVAFTAAGGKAEYNLLPPFGNEGHYMIDSPDAVPIWSPLVSQFLDKH